MQGQVGPHTPDRMEMQPLPQEKIEMQAVGPGAVSKSGAAVLANQEPPALAARIAAGTAGILTKKTPANGPQLPLNVAHHFKEDSIKDALQVLFGEKATLEKSTAATKHKIKYRDPDEVLVEPRAPLKADATRLEKVAHAFKSIGHGFKIAGHGLKRFGTAFTKVKVAYVASVILTGLSALLVVGGVAGGMALCFFCPPAGVLILAVSLGVGAMIFTDREQILGCLFSGEPKAHDKAQLNKLKESLVKDEKKLANINTFFKAMEDDPENVHDFEQFLKDHVGFDPKQPGRFAVKIENLPHLITEFRKRKEEYLLKPEEITVKEVGEKLDKATAELMRCKERIDETKKEIKDWSPKTGHNSLTAKRDRAIERDKAARGEPSTGQLPNDIKDLKAARDTAKKALEDIRTKHGDAAATPVAQGEIDSAQADFQKKDTEFSVAMTKEQTEAAEDLRQCEAALVTANESLENAITDEAEQQVKVDQLKQEKAIADAALTAAKPRYALLETKNGELEKLETEQKELQANQSRTPTEDTRLAALPDLITAKQGEVQSLQDQTKVAIDKRREAALGVVTEQKKTRTEAAIQESIDKLKTLDKGIKDAADNVKSAQGERTTALADEKVANDAVAVSQGQFNQLESELAALQALPAAEKSDPAKAQEITEKTDALNQAETTLAAAKTKQDAAKTGVKDAKLAVAQAEQAQKKLETERKQTFPDAQQEILQKQVQVQGSLEIRKFLADLKRAKEDLAVLTDSKQTELAITKASTRLQKAQSNLGKEQAALTMSQNLAKKEEAELKDLEAGLKAVTADKEAKANLTRRIEDIEAKEQGITGTPQDKEKLRFDIQGLKKDAEEIKQRETNTKAERKAKADDLKSKEKDIASKNDKLNTLSEELRTKTDLQKQLVGLKKELGVIQIGKVDLEKKVKDLKAKLTDSKANVKKARRKVGKAQNEVDSYTEAKREVQSSSGKFSTYGAKTSGVRAGNESDRKKKILSELGNKIKSLEDQIKNPKWTDRIPLLPNQAKADLKAALANKGKLEAEIKELKRVGTSSAAIGKTVKGKVDEIEAKIKRLQGEIPKRLQDAKKALTKGQQDVSDAHRIGEPAGVDAALNRLIVLQANVTLLEAESSKAETPPGKMIDLRDVGEIVKTATANFEEAKQYQLELMNKLSRSDVFSETVSLSITEADQQIDNLNKSLVFVSSKVKETTEAHQKAETELKDIPSDDPDRASANDKVNESKIFMDEAIALRKATDEAIIKLKQHALEMSKISRAIDKTVVDQTQKQIKALGAGAGLDLATSKLLEDAVAIEKRAFDKAQAATKDAKSPEEQKKAKDTLLFARELAAVNKETKELVGAIVKVITPGLPDNNLVEIEQTVGLVVKRTENALTEVRESLDIAAIATRKLQIAVDLKIANKAVRASKLMLEDLEEDSPNYAEAERAVAKAIAAAAVARAASSEVQNIMGASFKIELLGQVAMQ